MNSEVVLSFTGTRSGMTKYQIDTFIETIQSHKSNADKVTLVHGDCIGADADAHVLAMSNDLEIRIRPCDIENQRAFSKGGEIVAKPEHPLVRNKKIVDDGDELIACPAGYEEVMRSGTWATIRYAQRNDKPITIIWPDGTIRRGAYSAVPPRCKGHHTDGSRCPWPAGHPPHVACS